MTTALLAIAGAFLLVTLAELPDKTTVTTLVLTTRFPARAVLVGAGVAFALQTVVAVGFGSALTLLPEWLVSSTVTVLFASGAVILLRQSAAAAEDSGTDAMRSGPEPARFRGAALSSFGVLFAAEWADASQLATASLAAQSSQPILVGIGAFAALLAVTGLAVAAGRKLRDRIRPKVIQRCGGFLFAGFAGFAGFEAFLALA